MVRSVDSGRSVDFGMIRDAHTNIRVLLVTYPVIESNERGAMKDRGDDCGGHDGCDQDDHEAKLGLFTLSADIGKAGAVAWRAHITPAVVLR